VFLVGTFLPRVSQPPALIGMLSASLDALRVFRHEDRLDVVRVSGKSDHFVVAWAASFAFRAATKAIGHIGDLYRMRNNLHVKLIVIFDILILILLRSWRCRSRRRRPQGPRLQTRAVGKALKWANEQLRKMSLEEKIGQLISVGVNATFLNQDSDAYRALKHQIEDNKVGGVILFAVRFTSR
jgi:hypothetical protein